MALANVDFASEVPYRVDSGVAAAYTPGIGGYGFSGFTEPKLNLTERISVGARAEGAVMLGGNIDTSADEVAVSTNVAVATLVKGEFFLTRTRVRPFVGFGAGMYTFVGQGVAVSGGASVSQQAGRFFGVAPQAGINFGGFRLAATYNIPLQADIVVTQSASAGGGTVELSRNYMTLDFGFRWGGRRALLRSRQGVAEPPVTDETSEADESASGGEVDATDETAMADTDETAEDGGTEVAIADSSPPMASALPSSIDPRLGLDLATLDKSGVLERLGTPAADDENVVSYKALESMEGVRALRFHFDGDGRITRLDAWLSEPVARSAWIADLGEPDRVKDAGEKEVLIYSELKLAAYATKSAEKVGSVQLRF